MFLQLIASGVANGSIYALMALGMTILLRATTLINFSYGEFAMGAAYLTYIANDSFGLPYFVSIFLAFGALFLIGIIVERFFVRPLGAAPHLTLTLMIVAVSFLIKGIARFFFGRDFIRMPDLIDGEPIEFHNVIVLPQDLLVVAASILTVIVFFFFFEFTRFGKVMQAASQTPRGAALVGIDVPRLQSIMWGVTALMGALAGILIAPISLLYPEMGGKILIKGLAAMTLGGFGSLSGAVAGGFALGILENLASGYVASSTADIAAFVVIIAVLLIRPGGLFGEWKPSSV
ncbi:MAG: branched-chain amino acid ABC transporter permease [Rhodomicrobium sp.]